eukprot:m.198859 g.198859  ORF g.198859 m.198859 type:complete len:511 (-) comp20572_c0_seq1:35-1567(-)
MPIGVHREVQLPNGGVLCLCDEHGLELCHRCCLDFVEMNALARAEDQQARQQGELDGPDILPVGTRVRSVIRDGDPVYTINAARHMVVDDDPDFGYSADCYELVEEGRAGRGSPLLIEVERFDSAFEVVPPADAPREGADAPRAGLESLHSLLQPAEFPCVKCSTALARSKCGGCRAVHYCGRECQTEHWPTHKKFCKVVKKACGSGGNKRVLIVTGLGHNGPNDFWIERLLPQMRQAGLQVAVCDAYAAPDAFAQVGLALASDVFDTCILLQVGSSDYTADFFKAPHFKVQLKSWVAGGGTLLLHGERRVIKACEWFGKPWKNASYFRTTHHCFATGEDARHCCVAWYAHEQGAITTDISIKACLVNNVPRSEVLFGTQDGALSQSHVFTSQPVDSGLCAVAAGEYGAGYVGFFGDVNAEETTISTIVTLARGRTHDPARFQPDMSYFRRCPRRVKRVIVTVLLVAARLASAEGDSIELPALPWLVWYSILSMPTLAEWSTELRTALKA